MLYREARNPASIVTKSIRRKRSIADKGGKPSFTGPDARLG